MSAANRDVSRESPPPTIKGALAFRAKAAVLKMKRGARNAFDNSLMRFPSNDMLSGTAIIAESTSRLWTDGDDSEGHLLAGKTHNLRLAVRRLNGVEVPAGGMFSFWAQVGRTTRRRGYVRGRELREGCIIPAVGGGICQLSNALYDAALHAGFEIIERHAHSKVIPGSLAERGRDATVFWNYVDLRFKSPHAFRIEAALNADFLTVRLRGDVSASPRPSPVLIPAKTDAETSAPQNCFSCGVHECFRHAGRDNRDVVFKRSAYLVDEYWPEFDQYLRESKRERDLLLVPLDGKRFGKANYAWSTRDFPNFRQSWKVALHRSFRLRKLASQGATRQKTLLAFHEKLADSYAAVLPYDVTHVIVTQNLLPYLWRGGHLGGRTFDVLMTALPLSELHERLDSASSKHPESRTLADFRADENLVKMETEALRQARRIITPHSQIARLYGGRAVSIDWIMPPPPASTRRPSDMRRPRLVFPASTVGRKGAYELRAAIQGLDVQLTVVGAQLEGEDFWQGVSVEHRHHGENWLEGASAVVLPAYIEHRPRRLLEGVARGIPVIASTACGLESVKGVINISPGDVAALRHEIEKLVSNTATPPQRFSGLET
ncbi:MAG TPA: VanW family protein [Pyrinomonadaceae bacterium]|nr:VanW family protein [Pyrinomonadaceae bacterium]